MPPYLPPVPFPLATAPYVSIGTTGSGYPAGGLGGSPLAYLPSPGYATGLSWSRPPVKSMAEYASWQPYTFDQGRLDEADMEVLRKSLDEQPYVFDWHIGDDRPSH